MQETQRAVKTYENYIDGEWVAASSGETYETCDPGRTGEVVGRYPLSTADDANRAVEAAHRAFQEWRDPPPPGRPGDGYALVENWGARRDELAAEIGREHVLNPVPATSPKPPCACKKTIKQTNGTQMH